jgi:hypothetical protein
MRHIYKNWVHYVLFIRTLYQTKKKKWKKKGKYRKYTDFNEAIYNLAGFCVISYIFFFIALFELIFKFKGFIFLASKKIPGITVAFFGVILFYLIRYLLFLFVPKLRLSKKEKMKVIRVVLSNQREIRMIYPIMYVVVSSIVFLLTIGIFILAASRTA